MTSSSHEWMAQALQLARKGLYTTDPNPRVGCLLVKEGQIVGQGWHEKAGEPHAEVYALRQAGEQARGAVAYVTLEPCSHTGKTPPCADALIEQGIAKVVVAMQDPNPLVSGQGIEKLRAAGVVVEVGLLGDAAQELNCGFISRMEKGRPFVRLKLAVSLDGRTAMQNGESQWISGAESRLDVHRYRARSSAILTGIGTVKNDDPSLNVRLPPEQITNLTEAGYAFTERQPLRVVVDSHLSINPNARLLSIPGKVLIVCTCNAEEKKADRLRAKGADVMVMASSQNQVDLPLLLQELGKRGVNELFVEAGETLNGALLQSGLVDEVLVYMAPHLMGDQARSMFHLPMVQAMAARIPLQFVDVRQIGADLRLTLRPTRGT